MLLTVSEINAFISAQYSNSSLKMQLSYIPSFCSDNFFHPENTFNSDRSNIKWKINLLPDTIRNTWGHEAIPQGPRKDCLHFAEWQHILVVKTSTDGCFRRLRIGIFFLKLLSLMFTSVRVLWYILLLRCIKFYITKITHSSHMHATQNPKFILHYFSFQLYKI